MNDAVTVLPTGTVTFVFSDIEGSTVRWDANRDAMQAAVRRHDELMRAAIARNRGYVFKTIGDAFCAAFGEASDALAATLEAQLSIGAEDWSAVSGLRVRMAIHTGVADERDGDYYGPTVNRVARLLAIGHGGQVLVSGAAKALVEERLPPPMSLHDLGVHRLKDLSTPEHVFQLWAPDLAEEFPPLHSLDAVPHNLPLQMTAMVGRDSEVAEIGRLLERARIVELLGPGGIGKTRAALQVAADVAHDDGAWFVDLAPLDDPALVPSAIAAVFNVADEGGSLQLIDRVAAKLKVKKLLIVPDNCEHVVAAAAESVGRLLQSCPGVHVLATSREPLGIAGEEIYRMPTLPVPPADEPATAESVMRYAAAALFVTRARAAQQSFALTDRNAALVAEIVRRLDGIALAIELAAPRVKVLSLPQLAQRLDDRLKLLTGGARTALPRQQTLRALIGWSHDLLDEVQRRVLRQAAVFRGSWTLEAAEAICQDDDGSDVFDAVSALVDKSLVSVEPGEDEQRYRLLESTREFALEKLDEAGEHEATAARHAQYYAELARGVGVSFWQTDRDLWMAQVRLNLENFRAAIKWGLSGSGDAEAAAEIVAALRWYFYATAQPEGRDLASKASAALSDATPGRLRALVDLTIAQLAAKPNETSLQAAVRCLDDEDRISRAAALILLSETLVASNTAEAITYAERAIGDARLASAPRLLGSALANLAYLRVRAGDPSGAAASFAEAATVVRRCDDATSLARLQVIRAELSFAAGATEDALAYVREAEGIYRRRRHEAWLNAVLVNAAAYLIALGRFDEARIAAAEGLELALRRDDELYAAVAMGHLARVSVEANDAERAARLLGFVDATYERLGNAREPTEKQGYDQTVALLRAALPEERLASLMAEGAGMDLSTAATEASVPQPQI